MEKREDGEKKVVNEDGKEGKKEKRKNEKRKKSKLQI